jgi:cystathionine gamma-synthase
MKISDIALLAELGDEAGVLVVVDNTFASPALQQPIGLGAHVVVHSTTKYLGGHSDIVGGGLVFAPGQEELAERVAFMQFAAGAVSSPFDAFLTSRGIKTLGIRMLRHSQNALAIARRLEEHSGIEHVYYPGLESHPGHELAARQMSGYGGMISISLAGGAEAARRFAESTALFQLAESLGGVESLVNYPSEMTHASVRGTEAEVPESIVRLSVGIEDADDLLADIDQALERL